MEIKMKKILKITLLLSMILSLNIILIGCGNTNKDNSGKLNIVTTIFAPYDFARQIVGDDANITMLMSPGVETHSYEPSPADIIKISECDVFIYVGGENDEWVDGILETIDTEDITIIKLLDCVDVVEEEIIEGMESEEKEENHDSSEKEWDEHVWTSPANAIKICKVMEEKFEKLDNSNASDYKTNLDEYVGELNKLDEAFKEIVNNGARKTIIFGDRFPVRYFVEEYGLKYFAAFPGCSSETETSASAIAFLIDKVKDEKIPVVFKIELSTGNIAETISDATGAKVLTFYACHNLTKKEFDSGKTYVDFMWENVSSLREALK
jgi:zinc transport system substrate-binding protein